MNYGTNNGSLHTFSVDSENQLTSAPDGNCSYDTNGNLIAAISGLRKLAYDAENQLVAVSNYFDGTLSTKSAFVYDGMNRLRIKREYQWYEDPPEFSEDPSSGIWLLTSETRYLYDGWRVIQERDSNNVPTVAYTRGTDLSGSLEGAGGIGGLLARSHGYSSGTWSTHNYYFADGNGNILNLVNSSGTSQASYRYDPYGNLLSSSGTLAAVNAYRFSSKEWMATAGLYYYGYRFYLPCWQRWVNRDPLGEVGFETARSGQYSILGDGPNSYAFVVNAPLARVDAFGLWQVCTPYCKVFQNRKCRVCIGNKVPTNDLPPAHPEWPPLSSLQLLNSAPGQFGISLSSQDSTQADPVKDKWKKIVLPIFAWLDCKTP